jgi:hypothetical protein
VSNPFEEFLEEYGPQEKQAAGVNFSNVAGHFGKSMLGGVGTAVAAGVIGGTGLAATKIYGAATKARDFKSMMSFNPDLQEHHERDPRMFNQMFTSLRTMNPGFSKDPLVAGTYMRRMVENPSTSGGILTESAGSRDKFHGPFDKAIEEGMSGARSSFNEGISREYRRMDEKADPHTALRHEVEGMDLEKKKKDLLNPSSQSSSSFSPSRGRPGGRRGPASGGGVPGNYYTP